MGAGGLTQQGGSWLCCLWHPSQHDSSAWTAKFGGFYPTFNRQGHPACPLPQTPHLLPPPPHTHRFVVTCTPTVPPSWCLCCQQWRPTPLVRVSLPPAQAGTLAACCCMTSSLTPAGLRSWLHGVDDRQLRSSGPSHDSGGDAARCFNHPPTHAHTQSSRNYTHYMGHVVHVTPLLPPLLPKHQIQHKLRQQQASAAGLMLFVLHPFSPPSTPADPPPHPPTPARYVPDRAYLVSLQSHLQSQLHLCGPDALSMALWALAALRQPLPSTAWAQQWCDAALGGAGEWGPQALAHGMAGMAALRVQPPAALMQVRVRFIEIPPGHWQCAVVRASLCGSVLLACVYVVCVYVGTVVAARTMHR
jgi:hypothetical protein